jgi:hypothetical protein
MFARTFCLILLLVSTFVVEGNAFAAGPGIFSWFFGGNRGAESDPAATSTSTSSSTSTSVEESPAANASTAAEEAKKAEAAKAEELRLQAEAAAKLESDKIEAEKVAAAKKAEAAEAAKKAEEARKKAEAAKIEAAKLEAAKKAAEAARLEAAKRAEEARKQAEAEAAKAEEDARVENARITTARIEGARREAARKAEEARMKAEAEEAAKAAEAARLEAAKKEEEARKQAEAEEAAKAEEDARVENARITTARIEGARREAARKAEEARKQGEAEAAAKAEASKAARAADAAKKAEEAKEAAVEKFPFNVQADVRAVDTNKLYAVGPDKKYCLSIVSLESKRSKVKLYDRKGAPKDGLYWIGNDDLNSITKNAINQGLKAPAKGATENKPCCDAVDDPSSREEPKAELPVPMPRPRPAVPAELPQGDLCVSYAHFLELGVPKDPLKQALAYFQQNKQKFKNDRYVSIGDYSQNSRKKRFYLLDMKTGQLTNEKVSHGSGSANGRMESDPNNDGFVDKCEHP